ncbi:GNAT family N-acetyltransferase [Chitinophaga sp. sic0106]|uniref:GNAT family N-acetyltransferase n=1 Tax=Chitinophaga sp. sic0106 TaxID=2854785 RepID=UPI001C47453B|nr:GNAT family N-acetyltransferase [Chitinophaga sp. sic0106]MBV7530343.1 GNAT family N-acetyltransferase [Chitinophaga sp. sic0106]
MNQEQHLPLDNPAWHALQTIQRYFAQGTETVQRYMGNVLPFMAYNTDDFSGLEPLQPWISPGGESLFIIGELPQLPEKWQLESELVCTQMISTSTPATPDHEEEVIKLTEADRQEMVDFVNDGQPGYFKDDTPSLGNYYGIRKNGKLVALAGQRMKLPGYTEVSAVVTHPDYRGKGFARLLTTVVCRDIYTAGDVPFLHVVSNNRTAIGVYEKAGFEVRREISFWKIKAQ